MDGRSGGERESSQEVDIGVGKRGEKTKWFVTSYSPTDSTSVIDVVSTTASDTALAAGGHSTTATQSSVGGEFGSSQSFCSYGSEHGTSATNSIKKTVSFLTRPRMGNPGYTRYAAPEWQQEKLNSKGKFVV